MLSSRKEVKIQMELKEKLVGARKALHLSQTKIASMLGLHRIYINQIERGKLPLPRKRVAQFASAYKIDPTELRDLAAKTYNEDEYRLGKETVYSLELNTNVLEIIRFIAKTDLEKFTLKELMRVVQFKESLDVPCTSELLKQYVLGLRKKKS